MKIIEPDIYRGDVDPGAVRALNAAIQANGRLPAFEELYDSLGESADALVDVAVNDFWLPWLPLLDVRPGDRALDVGSGWGHVSVNLARRGCEVTAVDPSLDRLHYLKTRLEAEGLGGVRLAHVDDMRALPFEDAEHSLVVMHDVFDRLPEARGSQRDILREARRVSLPGGTLAITAPNRWSWRYWAGARDERTGLRYVTLMPRLLAELYSRACAGRPYSIRSHGVGAYRRMLMQAGFSNTSVYCPLPDHRRCKQLFDLDDRAACAHAVKRLMWCGRSSRMLLSIAQRFGVLSWFVPGYVITAEVEP